MSDNREMVELTKNGIIVCGFPMMCGGWLSSDISKKELRELVRELNWAISQSMPEHGEQRP